MFIAAMIAVAQVAQEEDQHQEHQHHPDRQVLDHGVEGRIDQAGAVVVRRHLVAAGENARGVQLVDFRLDALERLEGVAVLAHQNDPFDDLVLIVFADDSQPWRIADLDIGDVGNLDRCGIGGVEHDVANVIETEEETKLAHVERLLADAHIVAASVGV